jgi:hypothetical protein
VQPWIWTPAMPCTWGSSSHHHPGWSIRPSFQEYIVWNKTWIIGKNMDNPTITNYHYFFNLDIVGYIIETYLKHLWKNDPTISNLNHQTLLDFPNN